MNGLGKLLCVSAISLAALSAGPAEAGRRHYHHHHGPSVGGVILGLGVLGLTLGVASALAAPPPPPVYYPPPGYHPPPHGYGYAPPVRYAPPPYPRGGYLDAVPTSPVFTGPGGATCREFQSTALIGGRQEPIFGTACLQADGSWKVVP